MRVIVMRGLPGSGKSTFIKRYYPDAKVFSTDHQFIDDKGNYKFDKDRLAEAHAITLKQFIEDVQGWASPVVITSQRTVVVDNTNTRICELAPYVQIALAYGHDVQIITIVCDPQTAFKRNTHGVPEDVMRSMVGNLQKDAAHIPSWWNHKIIRAGDLRPPGGEE